LLFISFRSISTWKQPIFYDFDQKITKTLLLEIITALHDAGFEVKAAVSGMAPCNEVLWSSLGITSHVTSFEHPKTKSSIHVFASFVETDKKSLS